MSVFHVFLVIQTVPSRGKQHYRGVKINTGCNLLAADIVTNNIP